MTRDEILDTAKDMINGDRALDYGDAKENHELIAKIWSAVLGKEVTVSQVYLCMIGVKMARLVHTPDHEDSFVDIAGYSALGGES